MLFSEWEICEVKGREICFNLEGLLFKYIFFMDWKNYNNKKRLFYWCLECIVILDIESYIILFEGRKYERFIIVVLEDLLLIKIKCRLFLMWWNLFLNV